MSVLTRQTEGTSWSTAEERSGHVGRLGTGVGRGSGGSDGGRRVVVVGGGFGGIAAALRMRARGFRVTLVDRLDELGGRARVFLRGGYTFDAGPTVITAPFLIDELFELFGERASDHVSMVPVDPWYRVVFDDGGSGGASFDYTGDEERTVEQIRRFEPRDVDGYRRMMRRADEIYRVGYERLGDAPFDGVWSMARALPSMARLRSDRSVYGFAAAHLRDERLRRVFSFQPLLVGGHPFRTSSIYALIQSLERRFGVHYVMGGTGALVEALGGLLDRSGVEVRLGETVESMRVEGDRIGGVRLGGGGELAADLVVSNADPSFVYREMLPQDGLHRRVASRSRRMKQSMGLFVQYFGSRGTYPEIAHHTILLSDRYKPLLDDIFDRGVVPSDPSVYVHAPTRTDATMAPAGRECFYALAPVPNLSFGADWGAIGDWFSSVVLERVERMMAPGLRGRLEEDFYCTPAYFRDALLSVDGAGFGVEPRLSQSAYFRFHNRCPAYRNLFFVGAGTHPGAGVPGVLTTAKTLERVLDREGVVA